jgi:hypothetical protein
MEEGVEFHSTPVVFLTGAFTNYTIITVWFFKIFAELLINNFYTDWAT